MKKIFLVLAMLLTFNVYASDYQARYNMTAVFGKGEPAAPAPPKETCLSDTTNFWYSGTPSYSIYYILWDGVKVIQGGAYALTTVDVGGYRYTRKKSFANYGSYQKYAVCRIAI